MRGGRLPAGRALLRPVAAVDGQGSRRWWTGRPPRSSRSSSSAWCRRVSGCTPRSLPVGSRSRTIRSSPGTRPTTAKDSRRGWRRNEPDDRAHIDGIVGLVMAVERAEVQARAGGAARDGS